VAVVVPPGQAERWRPIAHDACTNASDEFELFEESAAAETWLAG
jgi:hypothetical protein